MAGSTTNTAKTTNTLLIEGTFEELAEELASYIDEVQRKQNSEAKEIRPDVTALLAEGSKDDVLKKLVSASVVLSNAPEKDFIAAYNLLIHLVLQSPSTTIYLPRITQNLCNPIASSPNNGSGLALSVLSTIFNVIPIQSDSRYHIFLAILRVVRGSGSYDALRPQLNSLDHWLKIWQTDDEDQRKLFLQISQTAKEAGNDDVEAWKYLLRAVQTISAAQSTSTEAHSLALKALKDALSLPSQFSFHDLIACEAVQALQRSEPEWFELLEIFNTKPLEAYDDFLENHADFVTKNGLDGEVLLRKMRLLSLASLAASTASRSLPYQHIAQALRIPESDVELWVIDVIRAGLVEGRLSQLDQTFLVHRSTYRVFGERQWREVQGRLDTWRASLEGVLAVIRAERIKALSERERETKDLEQRMSSMNVRSADSGPTTYSRSMGLGMSAARRPQKVEFDA